MFLICGRIHQVRLDLFLQIVCVTVAIVSFASFKVKNIISIFGFQNVKVK